MKRSMQNVNFYIDYVNERLREKGSNYKYKVREGYGYKELMCFNGTTLEHTRSGLTTGEVYEAVLAMYRMLEYAL